MILIIDNSFIQNFLKTKIFLYLLYYIITVYQNSLANKTLFITFTYSYIVFLCRSLVCLYTLYFSIKLL